MRKQTELVQGTLDMLILKAVSLGGLHGYGVLLRLEELTGGQLQIQQGSLYPALYRLERKGLIASEWGESENRRKAKYYSLTAAGRAASRGPGSGRTGPAEMAKESRWWRGLRGSGVAAPRESSCRIPDMFGNTIEFA